MKFYKNNKIAQEFEVSEQEIIQDFYKENPLIIDAPFERVMLNHLSKYGSFDVITEQQWNKLYKADKAYQNNLYQPKSNGLVKFKIIEFSDPRKQGSELNDIDSFEGTLSEDKKKVFYTDKIGVEWVFYINQTCVLIA